VDRKASAGGDRRAPLPQCRVKIGFKREPSDVDVDLVSARFSRSPPLSAHLGWDGDRAVLALDGELDLSTLALAERALTQAQVDGARGLVLDLGDVSFLDLSGLRLIFSAHERWGSALRVVRAARPVHDVLVFSGLASQLSYTESGRCVWRR
jgi:anti-anti-sigma factor